MIKKINISDKVAIQKLTKHITKRTTIEKFERKLEIDTSNNFKERENDSSYINNVKTVILHDFSDQEQFSKLFENEIHNQSSKQLYFMENIHNLLKIFLTNNDHMRENDNMNNNDNRINITTREIVDFIKNNYEITKDNKICIFLIQEFERKRQSYRLQDVKKKEKHSNDTIFDDEKLITIGEIIELLYSSKLKCYYCDKVTNIYYTNVRNNKQWTLDRLDNNKGHWYNNCVISCLSCNISRGRMDDDRFLKGKKMIIKRLN